MKCLTRNQTGFSNGDEPKNYMVLVRTFFEVYSEMFQCCETM